MNPRGLSFRVLRVLRCVGAEAILAADVSSALKPKKQVCDVRAWLRPVMAFESEMEKKRVFQRSAPVTAVLLLVSAAIAGCSEEKSAAQSAPPPPQVTVSKPTKKVVTDYDEYVGRFVAVDYVEVRARVSGYLDKIHFTDGQIVKVGDPLFTIDRRPFQAALDQAKGSIEQSKANLAFAKSDLARSKNLPVGTVISQQTLDQRVQAEGVAQANLTAAEAAARQADLDLQFTELAAPIAGRIGDRRVSVGNLVTGGTSGSTTLLATIVSVDPIRFEFTMDEASYLRYVKTASQKRADSVDRGLSINAELKLIDEKEFVHKGRIDFVDNAIDPSSGTIRGRAVFQNADGKLTPGMFGRIRIAASPPAEALLVPDDAIGTEQVRKFVYTLNADNVATPKYVTLGPVVDGLRVISTGLSPDDVVVVNGLMRIRPGAKVTPKQASADASNPKDQTVRTN